MSGPITSTANPLIKRIRSLEQRKQREAQGVYFVDGIRPVWQAVESRAGIETLIVAPELLTSEAAQEFVERQRAAGLPLTEVTPRVYESLSDREHPSGLGALVRIRLLALSDLASDARSFFVALEHVGNPGNLGTILRTMDGAEGSGVILIGRSTDPFNPTAVKSSMGALFTVPLAQAPDVEAVREWARDHGLTLVTTSASAPTVYWETRWRFPALILLGGEGPGLSEETWQQGDLALRIPMRGSADSLNLAVAAGLLMYEARRQLGPSWLPNRTFREL